MKLEIEKDKILEAAKKYPESRGILKTLCPDAFMAESAMNVATTEAMKALREFSREVFGIPHVMQILWTNSMEESGKALWVNGIYDVRLEPTHGGTAIFIYKK